MLNNPMEVEARNKVKVMKMRKVQGISKTLAVFDLIYDDALVIHGLFLKKINGWFHVDFPAKQINVGRELEYLDTCRPATLEWRRAITDVIVEEWSKANGKAEVHESKV